jgi:aminoglycoside phosphotransferase (APT) family kinase protein
MHMRDSESRAAIDSLRSIIDTGAAISAWETSLQAPTWDGESVWTHGDLLPPNLLVSNGRIRAVIDFGNVGVGDPAVDVIAAWTVFSDDGREAFRRALDVDDATWTGRRVHDGRRYGARVLWRRTHRDGGIRPSVNASVVDPMERQSTV